MDKKYIYRHVALKKETVEKLEAVQKQMKVEFGFEPSLQEVIMRLAVVYERDHPAPLEAT